MKRGRGFRWSWIMWGLAWGWGGTGYGAETTHPTDRSFPAYGEELKSSNGQSPIVYFPDLEACKRQPDPLACLDFLKKHMGEQDLPSEWGVSLAGGGSKAAAFGMGVLTGLAENQDTRPGAKADNLLASMDFVSSVSGGSYAAFYYFSHLLNDNAKGLRSKSDYQQTVGNLFKSPGVTTCEKPHRRHSPDNLPVEVSNQEFIGFHQDVLEPGSFSGVSSGKDHSTIPTFLSLLAASVLTMPAHHLSHTLFDLRTGQTIPFRGREEQTFPLSTPPSQISYKNGIGFTYGLVPKNEAAICYNADDAPLITKTLGVVRNRSDNNQNSDERYSANAPRPQNTPVFENHLPDVAEPEFTNQWQMSHLNDLYSKGNTWKTEKVAKRTLGNSVPYWVINATSSPHRNFKNWTSRDPSGRNAAKIIFEFTPRGFGSGQYGYVNASFVEKDQHLLTHVLSSAAFLDANERHFSQPWHLLAGVMQHTLNLDWGIDIANYNTGEWRQIIHSFLPFPLYTIDDLVAKRFSEDRERPDGSQNSAYIRLVDGGNAENLGAYSLIRRGVKNVVIADSAFDPGGTMEDICHLRVELKRNLDLTLHLPGLDGLDLLCYKTKKEQESMLVQSQPERDPCDNVGNKPYYCEMDRRKLHYPLHNWHLPVVVGCVSDSEENTRCSEGSDKKGRIISRIYLVKPAMSADFMKHTESPCIEDPNRPCKAIIFLAEERRKEKEKAGNGCGYFPQNSTVTMTADSSPDLYEAYKDLGRYLARKITWQEPSRLDDRPGVPKKKPSQGPNAYHRTIEEQADTPIRLSDLEENCHPSPYNLPRMGGPFENGKDQSTPHS